MRIRSPERAGNSKRGCHKGRGKPQGLRRRADGLESLARWMGSLAKVARAELAREGWARARLGLRRGRNLMGVWRTFTQVSVQWQDTDSMREELDDLQIFLSTRWAILLNLHVEMFRVNNVEDILQVLIVFAVESLELDFALLFPERHILLRVLPVLVVLATSSEKDSESLYKRVKINRLINIFKNDPVIPAFPDLHLSPAAILKELSICYQFSEYLDTKFTYQRHYLIINHIGAIRAEHDDFMIRLASSMNQFSIAKNFCCDMNQTNWLRSSRVSDEDSSSEIYDFASNLRDMGGNHQKPNSSILFQWPCLKNFKRFPLVVCEPLHYEVLAVLFPYKLGKDLKLDM
ncbi:transcription activator [Actinidia rufa]|uniref:Transcription activator n=1 Tax=Actinidia rufa TaxID=165716 RepID=A0A7J0DZV3_9ERIC|nr:transcription activator [Actinidia rufa]